MKTQYLLHFTIAGFTYYDGALAFDSLKIGIPLTLQCEPDNKHDDNAVAVYYNEYKLGYIPKSDNKIIAKLLQCGYTDIFDTIIQRVSPNEHPENQVQAVVRIKLK